MAHAGPDDAARRRHRIDAVAHHFLTAVAGATGPAAPAAARERWRVVLSGEATPAGGALVLALAREGSPWRGLGVLDDDLLAAIAAWRNVPENRGLPRLELDAVVWCLPEEAGAPRLATYRLGRLVRAARPRALAVVMLSGEDPTIRRGARSPRSPSARVGMRSLCRVACGRRVPILSVKATDLEARNERAAAVVRRLCALCTPPPVA